MRRLIITALTMVAVASILGLLGTTLFSKRLDVAPPRPESSPLSLDRHTSSFLVPVSISASRLASILDEHVPRTVAGSQGLDIGGNVHGERLDYTIRRGELNVHARDDRILIRAPLSGRATARAELCPFGRRLPCSDIQESADLRATVNATLSGIRLDSDWKPDAELTFDVDVSRAEVRLIGNLIPVSFRDRLTEEIDRALPGLTAEFADLLEELDLEPMLDALWVDMHRTFRLSENPETWLMIEPDSLGVSPLTASDDIVSASVVMSSDVSIHFGAEPTLEQRPMRRESIQPGAAPAFRLMVPITVDLDDLAAELNACCSPLSVSVDGATTMTFSDLTLTEHRGRLILGASFTMAPGFWMPRGTVYVLAAPTLDEHVLRLERIEFSVESESVLTKVVAEAARPAIVEGLQNALQVDLDAYNEEARASLGSAVDELDAGWNVDLRVAVDSIGLIDAVAGDGKLALVGELVGVATIDVVGP